MKTAAAILQLLVLSFSLHAQDDIVSSPHLWRVSTHVDDFTDETLTVIATVATETLDAVFGVACNNPEAANQVGASVMFTRQHPAGTAESTWSRVRWRVGEFSAHEEQWFLSGSHAMRSITNQDLDPVHPDADPLVRAIVGAPLATESMIFEVTDSEGDKHRGKVTLLGARAAVREVLSACQPTQ